MTPFRFKSFEGGITDKTLSDDITRYSIADNLLIDHDKKLISRDGWDIYSSTAYQLGAAERVARLVNFDVDSELLAIQNKKAFAIASGAWAEVVGPGGGASTTRAFNSNTAASLVEEAQWNHHLYLASNSGDPVLKMYRDANQAMQLRTAGMPEFTSALTPTDGGLALAIALANDIRTQMIAHFGANAASAGTPNNIATGHHMADGGGLLAAQATAASATVAATTLASLVTLLNALRTIYSSHISEAQAEDISDSPNPLGASYLSGASIRRKYHMRPTDSGNSYDPFIALGAANTFNQPLYLYRHYLNFSIQDPSLSVASGALIGDVLLYLNDLRDKWNWHTYAPMTHFNAAYWQGSSNFTYLASHKTALARVEPYTWASILPNYGPLTQFVKDLNTEYSAHRLNDMHLEHDTVWVVPAGVTTTPTTFHETITLLGWLAHAITYHAMEADTTFCYNAGPASGQFTVGTTSGSPSVSLSGLGSFAADKYKNARFVPMVGSGTTPFTWAIYSGFDQTKLYNITASDTAGTCILTLANNILSSFVDLQFVMTCRHYHLGDADGALFDPRAFCTSWNELDFTLQSASSLQGFADKAQALAAILENHTKNRLTAYTSNNYLSINSKRYATYHNSLIIPDASGTDLIVHSPPDNTNYPSPVTATGGGLYVSLNSALSSGNTAATQMAEDRFSVASAPEAASFNYRALFRYDYDIGVIQSSLATGNGAADGSITVAAPQKFLVGDSVYVDDDNSSPTARGYIGSVNNATGVVIVMTAPGGSTPVDLSGYTTAQNAVLYSTTLFTDRGAPSDVIQAIGFINEDSGGGTEIGKFAASISSLQVYANAANENFATADTVNFKKEIYRTIGNGRAYFRIDADSVGGSLANATTSTSDVTSDTYLVDQLELYTDDGSSENNRPPVASGVHVFNNTAYYTAGNKIYQSIPSDPDSVPSSYFAQFPENMIGVSSTRSVPVAFSATKVYRITGSIDSVGRGDITYESIFDRTGCISSQSIVKADNGIFFAGKDGFYFTDGYQCMRVTDLEQTFRSYTDTSAKRGLIQGAYDNISKRVYWTIQTGSGSSPDKIWAMDLQFGIKPDSTPITTLSCLSSFNPTALTYFGSILHYGDNDGYTFKQTLDRCIDLVKDTGTAATLWAAQTPIWDFKSCHSDFGSADVRKMATRISAQFEQKTTNLSVQIKSDTDKGRVLSSLPVIRSRKLITSNSSVTPPIGWGDSKIDWLASVYTAKAGSLIDVFRWFKGDGGLRANYRAIEMTNAYCVILNSTELGTITLANVSGTVWTATLTSLVATRKWPLYSVGYFVRIAAVDYPVTVRTSDSVVRIDTAGLTALSASVQTSWELWGYPKNEKMRLIGYTIDVEIADQQQTQSDGPVISGDQNG